jgi:hypothetical protein
MLDNGRPRGVELVRGRWRAPTCHAVGLLDEGDADTEIEPYLGRRHEISGLHAPTGAVAEDHGRPCLRDGM